MGRWMGWFSVAVAALPLLTLLRAWWLPRACDTTYVWEGYEDVPLSQPHSRYRLIRFKDGDPDRRAAYETLQRLHVVPVLFVHGHLGTHQQMRSAASETGRESARRLTANSSWPLWLQWYSADFRAEASALDAALLDKQADFVVSCIQHLLRIHDSSSRRQPFRLVLVGYSMGGIVAHEVVRRLSTGAAQGFDLSKLVVLVTLGSPHHFPSFMPFVPLTTILKPFGTKFQKEACLDAAAPPHISIIAGAGDFSLPLTHTRAAAPSALKFGPQLMVLMRDMPGVWSTTSHKGIVSCNQLVRQLVPLLVDSVMVTLEEQQGFKQWQTTVQRLLHQRLTTNTAKAMHWPAAAVAEGPHFITHQSHCGMAASAVPGSEHVVAPTLQRTVLPGRSLELAWDAAHLRASGWHGLLLLVTAAPPCSHWAVQATLADGGTRQLAAVAASLPPLLPSLRPKWVPRYWGDVMQGVDWQHNATRLLYPPFAGMPDEAGKEPQALSQLDVTIRGSKGGSTALLAQLLVSHPLEKQPGPGSPQHLRLQRPGRQIALEAGHPAAVALGLPQHVWPLDSQACRQGIGLQCLGLLLVGATPPWNLHIQKQQCSSAGDIEEGENLLPAILGVEIGTDAADSARVAATAGGSSSGAVHLWDGVAALNNLLLISDPRCAYTLRLQWDLGGWMGLSLRHLLFVLPTLCIALSQARLSPLTGSTTRVALASALIAAWGSLHPDMVASVVRGMQPWVQLSVVEALAAFLVAGRGVALVNWLLTVSLGLLRSVLPKQAPKHARHLRLASLAKKATAVAASSLLHPAAPAYLGCCCIAHALASSVSGRGSAAEVANGACWPSDPWLAWLTFYSQLALLPTVGLVAWLVGGMEYTAEWTDGRILVAALSMHACIVSQKRRAPVGVAVAAAHESAACLSAVSSLWGHPYVALYAAAGSALVDVIA